MSKEVSSSSILDLDVDHHSSDRCTKANERKGKDTDETRLLRRCRVQLQDARDRKEQDPNVEEKVGHGEAVQEWEGDGAVFLVGTIPKRGKMRAALEARQEAEDNIP